MLRLLDVDTRMGTRRSTCGVAAGLLLLASGTACASGRCTYPPPEPEALAPSEIPEVPDASANVLVDLSGALRDPARVTATFDDDLALDVEVAAHTDVCASYAIARYGYQVVPGPVTVEVSTGDGQHATASLVAGDRPRWVVVSLQEGFPLEVDVWTTEPAYG